MYKRVENMLRMGRTYEEICGGRAANVSLVTPNTTQNGQSNGGGAGGDGGDEYHALRIAPSDSTSPSDLSSSSSTPSPPPDFIEPPCTCDLFVPFQKEELVRRLIETALDNVLEELDEEHGGMSASSKGNGVRELKRRKVIKDLFPLHREVDAAFYEMSRADIVSDFCSVRNAWVSAFSFQPNSRTFVSWMRDYFGEKIGMYFAFLHFYNHCTLWLAVLGLAPALWSYTSESDNPLVVVYCVIIMIWAPFFVKFWNRRSNDYAFEWDMLEYEQQEGEMDSFLRSLSPEEDVGGGSGGSSDASSPSGSSGGSSSAGAGSGNASWGFYELEGRWVDMTDFVEEILDDPRKDSEGLLRFVPKNHVDTSGTLPSWMFEWYGRNSTHQSRARLERSHLNAVVSRYLKEAFAGAVITTLIGCVLSATISLLILKLFLTRVLDFYGSILAGIANGLTIFILDFVYKHAAIKMTEWENHRTATQFEEKLTAKMFVFSFVNSYFSLCYIAFVKTGLNNRSLFFGYEDNCKNANGDIADNCMEELASAIGTIIATRSALALVTQRFLPRYLTKLNLARLKLKTELMTKSGELVKEAGKVVKDAAIGVGKGVGAGAMGIGRGAAHLFTAKSDADGKQKNDGHSSNSSSSSSSIHDPKRVRSQNHHPHPDGDPNHPTIPSPSSSRSQSLSSSDREAGGGKVTDLTRSRVSSRSNSPSSRDDDGHARSPPPTSTDITRPSGNRRAVADLAITSPSMPDTELDVDGEVELANRGSSMPPPHPAAPPPIPAPSDGDQSAPPPTTSVAVSRAPSSSAHHQRGASLFDTISDKLGDTLGDVGDGVMDFTNDVFEQFSFLDMDKMSLEYQAIQPKYAINRNVLGTFDDYNELVIGYGYMVMFAAAFPIAPAIILVHNVIQSSTHGFKLIKNYQKPKYYGATDIGMFWHLLVFLTAMGVITNTAIICFTSRQLDIYITNPSALDRLTVGVVLEHIFGLLLYLVLANLSDFRPSLRVALAYNQQAKDIETEYAEYCELKRQRKEIKDQRAAETRRTLIDMFMAQGMTEEEAAITVAQEEAQVQHEAEVAAREGWDAPSLRRRKPNLFRSVSSLPPGFLDSSPSNSISKAEQEKARAKALELARVIATAKKEQMRRARTYPIRDMPGAGAGAGSGSGGDGMDFYDGEDESDQDDEHHPSRHANRMLPIQRPQHESDMMSEEERAEFEEFKRQRRMRTQREPQRSTMSTTPADNNVDHPNARSSATADDSDSTTSDKKAKPPPPRAGSRVAPYPPAPTAESVPPGTTDPASSLLNTSNVLRRIQQFDVHTRLLTSKYTQTSNNEDVVFRMDVNPLSKLDGLLVSEGVHRVGEHSYRLAVGKVAASENIQLSMRLESGPLPHRVKAYLVVIECHKHGDVGDEQERVGVYRQLTHTFTEHRGVGFMHFASLSDLRMAGCYKPKHDEIKVGLVIPSKQDETSIPQRQKSSTSNTKPSNTVAASPSTSRTRVTPPSYPRLLSRESASAVHVDRDGSHRFLSRPPSREEAEDEIVMTELRHRHSNGAAASSLPKPSSQQRRNVPSSASKPMSKQTIAAMKLEPITIGLRTPPTFIHGKLPQGIFKDKSKQEEMDEREQHARHPSAFTFDMDEGQQQQGSEAYLAQQRNLRALQALSPLSPQQLHLAGVHHGGDAGRGRVRGPDMFNFHSPATRYAPSRPTANPFAASSSSSSSSAYPLSPPARSSPPPASFTHMYDTHATAAYTGSYYVNAPHQTQTRTQPWPDPFYDHGQRHTSHPSGQSYVNTPHHQQQRRGW